MACLFVCISPSTWRQFFPNTWSLTSVDVANHHLSHVRESLRPKNWTGVAIVATFNKGHLQPARARDSLRKSMLKPNRPKSGLVDYINTAVALLSGPFSRSFVETFGFSFWLRWTLFGKSKVYLVNLLSVFACKRIFLSSLLQVCAAPVYNFKLVVYGDSESEPDVGSESVQRLHRWRNRDLWAWSCSLNWRRHRTEHAEPVDGKTVLAANLLYCELRILRPASLA